MIYGSICSGIEAASVAWHPLGWRAAFLSEIEAFPRAVLQHHYPSTPLHGDFTTIQAGDYEPIDLLVGGTPCQSFSIAGLRGGLADERGNLALEFLALAGRLRPRWIVWENVPGVLSSGGGRDFGSFLGGLVELGYGFAYRVLDAQFFGLAQRRKRVFVVGHLGDWRRAWAVLSQPASLRWDSPPRREAGEGATGGSEQRAAVSSGRGWWDDSDVGATVRAQDSANKADTLLIARCLNAPPNRSDGESETFVTVDCSPALRARANDSHRADSMAYVAHALRADGLDASEGGTGRGTPLAFDARQSDVIQYGDQTGPLDTDGHSIAVAFDPTPITSRTNRSNPQPGGPCHTLAKGQHAPAVAFDILGTPATNGAKETDLHVALRSRAPGASEASTTTVAMTWSIMPQNSSRDYKARQVDVAQPVMAGGPVGGNQGGDYVQMNAAVRRLTPRECARLQGFPDDYLDITFRGRPAADGNKYRALGNSFAVPVVRWIGQRIAAQEADIRASQQAAA